MAPHQILAWWVSHSFGQHNFIAPLMACSHLQVAGWVADAAEDCSLCHIHVFILRVGGCRMLNWHLPRAKLVEHMRITYRGIFNLEVAAVGYHDERVMFFAIWGRAGKTNMQYTGVKLMFSELHVLSTNHWAMAVLYNLKEKSQCLQKQCRTN